MAAALASHFTLSHPRSYLEAIQILHNRTNYAATTAMQASVWNHFAKVFNNSYTELKSVNLSKTIGRLARMNTAKQVLETASGAGYSAGIYSKMMPDDGQILVTDIADAYTGVWSQMPVDKKVRYEVMNAEALTYGNEAFDRYICCSGFTQFTRPDLAIKEAYRVLKPGGIMVGNMSISCSYQESIFGPGKSIGILPNNHEDLLNTCEDPKLLVHLSEQAGFQDIKTFEDHVYLDFDTEEFIKYINSLVGFAVSKVSEELQTVWRHKTKEVVEYYLKERNELIAYKTIGVRAIKT